MELRSYYALTFKVILYSREVLLSSVVEKPPKSNNIQDYVSKLIINVQVD